MSEPRFVVTPRGGLVAVLVALLLGFALGSAPPPALAGPPWKDKGHDADYEDHRGGPPPWAPAHGYRRKQEHKHKHKHKHEDERRRHARAEPEQPGVIDVGLGRCNRDLIGAVIGGTIGGVIGSQVGESPAERAIVTAGGVIVGAVIGGVIGRRMDDRDHACVAHALALAPHGRAIRWENAATGARYTLTPLRPYEDGGGRSCREYVTAAEIDGGTRWTRGSACRQPDGIWQRVS